jgi:hypothetical protein
MKTTLGHAITVGRLLIEAKGHLKHGEWLPWLEANCEIGQRGAQLYMRLARKLPTKSATIADLGIVEAIAMVTKPKPRTVRVQVQRNDLPARTVRVQVEPLDEASRTITAFRRVEVAHPTSEVFPPTTDIALADPTSSLQHLRSSIEQQVDKALADGITPVEAAALLTDIADKLARRMH